MKIKGLIFFDIDGTLTRGVNSGTFIADRLGIGEQMRAAEEAYARGEMDNAAVCRVDAAGYAGLPVSMVESWLDDMPLIDGIAPALTVCRAAGFVPYVASCTWSYIGAYLARRSDIPLFQTVGASLALNASDAARAAASHAWDGADLAEAIQFFLGETQG